MRLAAALLCLWAAAGARAADEELGEELKRVEDSNIDASMRRAKPEAERAAALSVALLASGRARLRAALGPAPGGLDGDDDDPKVRLGMAVELVAQKEAAFRRQAAAAGLALPETAPSRDGFRAADRERDARLAEADLAKALERLKRPKIELEGGPASLCALLRSALAELRRGREAAARLAGAAPSKDWRERLAGLDRDADDLAREARLLELALSLRRAEELSFDAKGD